MRFYDVVSDNKEYSGLFIKEIEVNELLTRVCVANHILPQSVPPQVFELMLEGAFASNLKPVIYLATPQFGNFNAIRISFVLILFEKILGIKGDNLIDVVMDCVDEIYELTVEEEK